LLTATRAALYMRVSTGRHAEHDLSIPDQKTQMQAWVAQHAGPSLPGTSNSAPRLPTRSDPEFQRMIECTCDGESAFDVIVAIREELP